MCRQTLEVDAFKLELRREAAEAAEAPKVETEVATFKKGERGWIQKSDRNLAKKQQARRQQAVAHWEFDEGGDPITPPGFAVERDVSLSQLLGRLQGPRLWLHEYGTHVARECEGLAGEGSVVVVGDQIGFTAEEEALLEGWEGVRKISLGATVRRRSLSHTPSSNAHAGMHSCTARQKACGCTRPMMIPLETRLITFLFLNDLFCYA